MPVPNTQGVLPLTVAILAGILLKERLSSGQKAGIVLIVGGRALAIAGMGLLDVAGRQSIGHLIFLAATLLWASYTVAMRRGGLDGSARRSHRRGCFSAHPICRSISVVRRRVLQAPLATIAGRGRSTRASHARWSRLCFTGHAVKLLGASSAGSFIALEPVIGRLLADSRARRNGPSPSTGWASWSSRSGSISRAAARCRDGPHLSRALRADRRRGRLSQVCPTSVGQLDVDEISF